MEQAQNQQSDENHLQQKTRPFQARYSNFGSISSLIGLNNIQSFGKKCENISFVPTSVRVGEREMRPMKSHLINQQIPFSERINAVSVEYGNVAHDDQPNGPPEDSSIYELSSSE